MTAFELRNVVSRPLGMVAQSILSRHDGGLAAVRVRAWARRDGTNAIDRDAGSDAASITYT